MAAALQGRAGGDALLTRLADIQAHMPLPPRGLNRSQAAAYVGISPTQFDKMVIAGDMPGPRKIGKRRVWDRIELDQAFEDLPRAGANDDTPFAMVAAL